MQYSENGRFQAIGELESLTLLAILRLGGETYGVPVRDEIEARVGKRLTRGAIYTGLARLEKKGFLESKFGPPTPERGGKRKRLYSVSPLGLEALRASTAALARMRAGLEPVLGDA